MRPRPTPSSVPPWSGAPGLLLALLGGTLAICAATGWPLGFGLGPLRVSVRSPRNPAIGGAARRAVAQQLEDPIERVAPVTAATPALAVTVMAWQWGVTGRRLAGNIAGLLAAAATASSPIVLDQAFQPMSDVPAACAWLVAAVALARGTRTGDAAAAAAAIAVRPPIAVAALAFSWWQRWLYRGATETGYGAFGSLFSPAPVRPNLATSPKWLFESHGYTWLLGLVAPSLLAAGRRRPSLPRPQSPVYRSRERRAISAFVFLVRSGATVNGR